MARTRKENPDSLLFIFLGALIFVALIYGPLFFLNDRLYLKIFFFRSGSWPFQTTSTYLFGVGICFLISRYVNLRRETKVANLIDVQSASTISSDTAKKELERVPTGLRETLAYRRISELLKGYLNGEEVIRLNEELSRRDNDLIDRGHALLDSIRQLIPVIGFLGTVFGLALGMVAFPENMAKAATIDNLRETLRDFASSLSVAFETTVLALVYTIIIILITTVLKEREAGLVSRVDRFARDMVSKFRSHHSSMGFSGTTVGSDLESLLNGWLDRWEVLFKRSMEGLAQQLHSRNQ